MKTLLILGVAELFQLKKFFKYNFRCISHTLEKNFFFFNLKNINTDYKRVLQKHPKKIKNILARLLDGGTAPIRIGHSFMKVRNDIYH